MKEDEGRPISS